MQHLLLPSPTLRNAVREVPKVVRAGKNQEPGSWRVKEPTLGRIAVLAAAVVDQAGDLPGAARLALHDKQ